ncbi:MAG: hypothetical protein NTW87_10585, partial [Planctomycetota bacterium]|nr:hypothetical protein [Planctomycetota bacterium]
AMRFALAPKTTWVGQGTRLVALESNAPGRTETVETCAGRPQFVYEAGSLYWLRDGHLLRDTPLGPESVGEVLPRQTAFWMGPAFGFGFYRAGQLTTAFVFKAGSRGINDSVPLPPMPGQWVRASCAFPRERCWFFLTLQQSGQMLTHVIIIRPDGTVEARECHKPDENGWLAGVRGACATGNMLMVPTDEGIVRLEVDGGSIVKTRTFLDTEPFVDANCRLLIANNGLHVIRAHTILRLAIKP